MSEKRMALHLTVSEIQRQKWTGGSFYPPLAGIRVKTNALLRWESLENAILMKGHTPPTKNSLSRGDLNVHITPFLRPTPFTTQTASQSVQPFVKDWHRILPIRYIVPSHFPKNCLSRGGTGYGNTWYLWSAHPIHHFKWHLHQVCLFAKTRSLPTEGQSDRPTDRQTD